MDTNLTKGSGVLNQTDYTSATVLSTAANFIMNRQEPFTHTYRTYIRLRENGTLKLKFWHSNAVDSTWDQGQEAVGSEPGGDWVIETAYIADGGTEPDGTITENTQHALTFEGKASKTVAAGECFWSDETSIVLPEVHYLAFTWTIKTLTAGKSIPFNVEGMLATAYDGPGNLAAQQSADGFTVSDNLLVLPSFIGYKKSVTKRLVFLGDSITQGVRTLKDAYEYWVARIADGLSTDIGVWNLGSGWARAYDVAADGPWLNKAKQSDEVMIVLGVNDIDIGCRSADELLGDLQTLISKIKGANAEASIILGTVPPFNFQGEREETWRKVNREILSNPPIGVSRVFDIASLLSLPAPDDHLIRPEYMSGTDDPHPNGEAGKTVADAFLKI
jgi:lysophospholipase L1-like esterase